jgi:serine/threonine protein kinase
MELADKSLHDLLVEYRAAGRPGVPRGELLRYLNETAEVLDLLNYEQGLQHVDVKPRNLFLVGRHIKVADFGLVNSLAELYGAQPHALQLGAVTPLYAAPECFLGKITLFSDQYSLAVCYCELLTGALPFAAKNFRQAALQHLQAGPELLDSLRAYLQAMPERRRQERLRLERAVEVRPAGDAALAAAVAAQTEDVSLGGMGLSLPCRPPAPEVLLRLPADDADGTVLVPAQIVWARPLPDGSYEVGVRFLRPTGV